MTLATLAAYRQWQAAVDAKTATGELAILLRRQVAAAAGNHEAGVFTALAMAHVVQGSTGESPSR